MTQYNDQQEKTEHPSQPSQYPYHQFPPMAARPVRSGFKSAAIALGAVSWAVEILGLILMLNSLSGAPGAILGPTMWLGGMALSVLSFIFLCLI